MPRPSAAIPTSCTPTATDPLNYLGKMRARTGAEILATVQTLGPRLAVLRLPLYVLHGTADRLVPIAATDWVEQHAGSSDVTVRRLEGLYHEPHNEPERDEVLAGIVEWFDRHLAPVPSPREPA